MPSELKQKKVQFIILIVVFISGTILNTSQKKTTTMSPLELSYTRTERGSYCEIN